MKNRSILSSEGVLHKTFVTMPLMEGEKSRTGTDEEGVTFVDELTSTLDAKI